MSDPNDGYGNGYESNGYGSGGGYGSNSGYGQSPEPNGYEQSEQQAENPMGSNPYQTDRFQDGYRENPYQVNFEDNAYTETIGNPDPNGIQSQSRRLPGQAVPQPSPPARTTTRSYEAPVRSRAPESEFGDLDY